MTKAGSLPARHPEDGARLEPGRVYVARPDHHLTVEDSIVRVFHGPRENGHRPAIEPLFRSAASAFGRRVIAIRLSGMDDDGFAGLLQVKAAGGLTVVQSPADALFPQILHRAIREVRPNLVLPAHEIGLAIRRLVQEHA